MSLAASFEVQKALYEHLSTSTSTRALRDPFPLFDEVPEGQSYPYVLFGAMASRPLQRVEEGLAVHDQTLEVWSQRRGSAQAKTYLTALVEALSGIELSLSEGYVIDLQITALECEWVQEDFLTRGAVELRITTQV